MPTQIASPGAEGSVSPEDGSREWPGVSVEGVAHRGLCVMALEQVQRETKEEIEGEAQQGENSPRL